MNMKEEKHKIKEVEVENLTVNEPQFNIFYSSKSISTSNP